MDGISMGGCYYDTPVAGYEGEEDMADIRKGPWTSEEDLVLTNYIHMYGEGRWNSLARCAGLKRTGKSCRLRWLNYLRPDVRRGNITLEEQLLILQLHSRWGNRWSKIAQYLPGRTDNEIKNYWRTRVQKQAKQLKCDVNSKQFRDTMRCVWIPRLAERIRAASDSNSTYEPALQANSSTSNNNNNNNNEFTGHTLLTDPTHYYNKSDGSSATSSETTQFSRPNSYIANADNIHMGVNGSNLHEMEGMDLDYLSPNQNHVDWLGGKGSSIDVNNSSAWSDEDIYDDLDAWLGDQ